MKYTIWTYQEAGFGHGWKLEQSDTIPEGAVSIPFEVPFGLSVSTISQLDRSKVYCAPNVAEEDKG